MPEQLIFKVVPDYTSRINQLEKKEIDLMEKVKTEDVKSFEQNKSIIIKSTTGREYDYIGWNNIDAEVYQKEKRFEPNKLFGSPEIRKALTCAINRKALLLFAGSA